MNTSSLRTVSELVDDYLSERLLRPATNKLYRDIARRFTQNTGLSRLSEIDAVECKCRRISAVICRGPIAIAIWA